MAKEDMSTTEQDIKPGQTPREEKRKAAPIDPRLIRRAQATRVYLIAGVVVGSLTAVLVLTQASLLSTSIAAVFDNRSLEGLGLTLALLVAVLIGRAILAWASAWFSQRTSAAVKSQLRRDIMASRIKNPAHQTSSSSSLVNLATQGLDALDGYFSKYLPQLLLAVTVPLIIGVAILTQDWLSAVIIAATIPFIPILMALVGRNTEKKIAKRWAYQARLASHFADLISGLPTLQVFGRAKAQAQGLKRTETANRRETLGILRIAFLSAFVLELFATIAVAVVALVIASRLVYGQMEFSTALFILILAPEVYLPLRQVGVHYHDSAHGLAAAEAAFKEIDRAGTPENLASAQVQVEVPSQTYPPSVSARNLRYTYPGTSTEIGPFDLEVKPGEVVAIAGRSGGGKTTLLNCILGFLTPQEGSTLTLGGVDAPTLSWDSWRHTIAYVPQIPGMIDGTIADNVRLGCPTATDNEVHQMLAEAGATTLDPSREVGEEGEGLSVGERRRVGIARALARIHIGGARLLILDEPTAGLDVDTEATVLVSVRNSGATALVVSHREAVLEAADRVVEIQSGEAPVEETPTAELKVTESKDVIRVKDNITEVESLPDKAKDITDAPIDLPEEDLEKRYKGSPLVRLVFRLLDAVPGAKMRLVFAVLLTACASGAAVALMGVSAWLISRAAQQPNFLELSVGAVGVRFFGISRAIFRYLERLVGHEVALSMQSALRLKTYQSLSKTTLLGRKQGDLLVRVVADVNGIEDIVVRIVQPFLSAAVVVVGVCAILAPFSAGASLAILVSAVLAGLLVPWMTQRASQRDDAESVPLRGNLGVVVHDLSRNAIDLAAYGAQAEAVTRMDDVDRALVRVEERSAWVKGLGAGLQTLASGIGFIGGLWIGSYAVVSGDLNETMLAVFVLVPLALHEVFANFTQAAQTWTRAKVSLDRVTGILDAPPVGQGDVDVRDATQKPTLKAKNLSIGWPGYPNVAEGIDLDLAPGEAIAVMGPSGIGKTTLAATVMGLIPPVEGELTTTGRIGYLAQDAHIFSTTIAENVRIGNKDATDDEVRAALAEAGLDMPLDREAGEMGVGLSGGEARRLALARLFVGNYRLLILDEPTEHLDRDTADTLMDEIFAGVSRRPVMVISHDELVGARCDRVLTMDGVKV
jgi:ATP-binding cassette subfamily C protein CydCD